MPDIPYGRDYPDPPDIQPDDEIGAVLLDDLRATLTRYVVFADANSSAAVALWIAATHALPAFECAPRLVLTSPQKRCAKSRTLDLIAATCYRPLATSDATVAAIFRSIGSANRPPTLIIDEADAIWGTKKQAENNEDLRKLLNAGHQRGRPAIRCVGQNQTPTPFTVFAMAALAGKGTGWVPDTIMDRAVNITMRRRLPGEVVDKFRSRRDGPVLQKLRDRLTEWVALVADVLREAEPSMPVEDRAADTWEPLIAIADAAGGQWPITARRACRALVDAADAADEDQSSGVRLLSDIRDIFEATRVSFLPSIQLVGELKRIEDAPWGEWELNPSKLAFRLRDYGIKTGRNTAGTARGYRLEDFRDSFQRYTRQNPSEASDPQLNNDFASDEPKNDPSEPVRSSDASDTVENDPSDALPLLTSDSDILTPSDGVGDGNGPPRCDKCGTELETPESIKAGRCAECRLSANQPPPTRPSRNKLAAQGSASRLRRSR